MNRSSNSSLSAKIFRLSFGVLAVIALQMTAAYAATPLPDCEYANSDVDNDGYGWENNTSCKVVEVLPVNDEAACIDYDPIGDGWGWDGSKSCRIEVSASVPTDSPCIDYDPIGDGWGWDGTKACVISMDEEVADVVEEESICIDYEPIGDGWGWNGTKACRISIDEEVTEIEDAACIDYEPIGDGWGWNGTKACRIATDQSMVAEDPVANEAACVDYAPLGDGWGWDGEKACRVACAVEDQMLGSNICPLRVVEEYRVEGLDVDRFLTITTQNEFTSRVKPLAKFEDGSTIEYSIYGNPTDADYETVDDVMDELRDLTNLNFVEVYDSFPAIKIHFEPASVFPTLSATYGNIPGTTGFFEYYNDYRGVIYDGTIGLDTGVSQADRDHATWEEITQVLGFPNDTFDQDDSIFAQYFNRDTGFNESDKRIITAMYTTGLLPGMTTDEIREFFAY